MSKNIKEVDIVKLEYPDNIRTRQGMYGSDGTDATILFREVVDNTIDLATKFKLSINVESWINQNDWNVVVDNGLGFPIYKDMDFPNEDRSIVRDMMCKVNVGSNFNQTQYSTGQNGVGTRLTQALSNDFILLSNANKKDKKTLPKFIQEGLDKNKSIYIWHSKKGRYHFEGVLNKLELVDYLKSLIDKDLTKNLSEFFDSFNENEFGTMILFKPDSTLLESTKVNYKGYPFSLVKELFKYDTEFNNINLIYKLNGKEIQPYSFTSDFKEKIIEDKVLALASSIKTEDVLPIKFICQFAWCSDKFNTEVNGSVNLLETPVGKHLNIVQNALGQALTKYNPLLKSNDARYGLRLFVLNLALKPLFNSQDKTKLSKWEDKGYNEKEVIKTLADSFLKLMKENSEYFDLLCERIIEYKRATEKLSNIELLKSKIVMGDESDKKRIISGQMSRVYECTSDDYSKRELYIVEGLSASGNLLQTRNKLFQAILPLQGKMRNTSTLDEERLVDNKEVLAIVNTIGCGLGGICDPSKSRYNKVIIASDFDSDGCLLGDTVIDIQKEGRTFGIEIKELVDWKRQGKLEGTYAKSFNVESGMIEYKPIINAILTKYVTKDDLLTYRFSNLLGTQHVTATKNHLFYTKSGRYVRLDELNEEVITDSNPGYFDLGVNPCLENIDNDMLIPVYDIEVQDNHNFYANDVLVHNSHIANLITTLFLHHAPEMIKQGYLYKVEAPYYKVIDGKKVKYYYHDEKNKIDFSKEVHKLKGLGSYTKEEAKQFLMDTKERRLIPIVWNPDMEYEIQEASKLMYSGLARKKLMIERGIFNQEDIL